MRKTPKNPLFDLFRFCLSPSPKVPVQPTSSISTRKVARVNALVDCFYSKSLALTRAELFVVAWRRRLENDTFACYKKRTKWRLAIARHADYYGESVPAS